ncbi:hypothetical protein Tco_1018338 [Tanacetum coccineum]|uniref:Uncharacterized protein n=1 Tax=Tanacetum coccineum TaxID=301880 RepID=A0ABQ5FVF8_9ASTR
MRMLEVAIENAKFPRHLRTKMEPRTDGTLCLNGEHQDNRFVGNNRDTSKELDQYHDGVLSTKLLKSSQILSCQILKHSTVSYTSVFEDVFQTSVHQDVDGPPIMPEVPPSPDYIPGPEGPPSPRLSFLPSGDEEPEEDDEEDPEEDPTDYPADRGDDDDDDAEEEEHLAPADPKRFAYSADRIPILLIALKASLPNPPPSRFLSHYSSTTPQIPLHHYLYHHHHPIALHMLRDLWGSRSCWIRQRDALPFPVHETEMLEICLPLRKRPRHTTPGPGYEVGESSTAGAARQFGPTTAEADLVGSMIIHTNLNNDV